MKNLETYILAGYKCLPATAVCALLSTSVVDTTFLPHYSEQTVATTNKILGWADFLAVDQALLEHTAFTFSGKTTTTWVATYSVSANSYYLVSTARKEAFSLELYFIYRDKLKR